MIQEISATYTKGVLKLARPLHLDEGAQVVVSVAQPTEHAMLSKSLEATAGAWKDSIDCDKLLKDVYASRSITSQRNPTF